jgi:glycosyltransferase involved in cell wall biosynthesis
MSKNSLYISYFGIREPLVQTQVIPYLRELVAGDWSINLMTFEPGWPDSFSNDEIKQLTQQLSKQGITWYPRQYIDSRSIFSKVRDIISGMIQARRIIRRQKIAIVHGRAHVGTTIGLLACLFSGPRLLFDIRGFNPEEQVEAGRWNPSGLNYRLFKWMEKWLLKKSSGFVVLTQAGRKALFPESTKSLADNELYHLPDGRPIQVIPCCVDPSRFINEVNYPEVLKVELGLGHCARLIAHVGALGGLYPEDRIVAVFDAILKKYPDSGFVMLSQTSTEQFKELYDKAGLPPENLWIGQVPVSDVNKYLAICHWGLSLKKESYSQLSCSPTKIPEYLQAGLPVLCSQGIGDSDGIILENQIGLVFDAWSDENIRRSVAKMHEVEQSEGLQQRCRTTARDLFDLKTIGGPRYRAIYETLMKK